MVLASSPVPYDSSGRCVEIDHPHFSESITAFDGAGNPLMLKGSDALGPFSCSYAYDPLGQLISETGFATHTYVYDGCYNRLSSDTDYQYDLAGRLIQRGNASYTYDDFDRLIRVETPDTAVAFGYDSSHRRLSKTTYSLQDDGWVEQSRLRFLYIGSREIGAVNDQGEVH